MQLAKGKNVINTKWVYRVERKSNDSIDGYKAEFVTKGYAQKYGIDYEETSAPTSPITTICIMIALVSIMEQLDNVSIGYKKSFLE